MKEIDWWGAYSSSLKGRIVDSAFSHPAKMSWGLTVRIFQHLFDEGWLKKGDLVADPFGGIGSTGLVAAAFGCPCILVELEQKFVDLAEQNFELHREQWEKMGKPHPVILQGDSRRFSSIIGEAINTIITSPPFLATEGGCSPRMGGTIDEAMMKRHAATHKREQRYGTTEGQIGAMKEGKLDEVVAGIVTSPPYSGSPVSRQTAAMFDQKDGKSARAKAGGKLECEQYGNSEGQLGGMPEGNHAGVVDGIITSPPYANSMSSEKSGIDWSKCRREDGRPRDMTREPAHATRIGAGGEMRYSPSSDNVGNLPEGSHEAVVDAVVTSPPWEKTGTHYGTDGDAAFAEEWQRRHGKRIKGGPMGYNGKEYGSAKGQIGQVQGGTYWLACKDVYLECLAVLKPGGVMAVVVKAFVRNKKIIDLPSQTLELLEAIGFEPLERIRAWMTSPATQKSLMPELVGDYTRAKKSFFRRLYEKKYPRNRIDFEEVLIVRKSIQ